MNNPKPFQFSVKIFVQLSLLAVCGVATLMIPQLRAKMQEDFGGGHLSESPGVDRSTAGEVEGDFDASFNPNGTGAGPQLQAIGQALAVQADGKIIFGGNFLTYNDDPAAPDHIMLLTTAGVRDPSFNSSGPGANQAVYAVAAQPDGKIVIGGTFTGYNGDTMAPDAIIRLNADGTRDTGFNAGGSGTDGVVNAVAVQPDGKIIIGCGCGGYNGNTSAPDRIMRLNADGTRDLGFNAGGAGLSGGVGVTIVNALAVQTDGKIIVGGNFTIYNGDTAANNHIMRLNSDGTRDADFNPGGAGAISQVRSVAMQSDGKIIIGGDFTIYNGDGAASDRIMRLNADGTPDASFNAGGAGTNSPVLAAAVQADGKIVIGGQFTSYNGDEAASDRVMRLNANGTRDAAFNVGGGGSDGNVLAVALQLNGKIIIAGSVSSYNGNAAVPDRILRLNGGSAPASVTGKVSTPGGLGIRNAVVALTDPQGVRQTATTSSFGVFTFNNVATGQTYIISVSSKRYRFAARSLPVNENLTNVDFVGLE
jgi:uncharacterized delta-60 repeat protein